MIAFLDHFSLHSNGKAHDGGYFGPGSSSLHILLDDVDCTGEEKSIADCSHSDWLVHDCVHAEDAGVTCFNKLDTATVTNKVATTTSLKTTSTEGSSTTTSSTLSPVSFSTVQSPTPKPEIGKIFIHLCTFLCDMLGYNIFF